MKISFLRESELEFLETISYYKAIQPELGKRFKEEVDRSLLWIAARPEACRLRSGGYRRINFRAFPFYVPYIVRDRTLWVLAVAHTGRRPEYWIQRKRDLK